MMRYAAAAAGVVLLLLFSGGAEDAAANLLGERSGGGASEGWGWMPGPLRDFFAWVVVQQAQFSRDLQDAVNAYRDGDSVVPAIGLISIAFVYGVFHAVGPGHGKAVVTGYFLARESEIRRGLALGWLIAGIQTTVAVTLVGVLGWVLDFSRLALLDSMPLVELGSYGLVVLLGAGMTIAVLRGHGCGHDHGPMHSHEHNPAHNHDHDHHHHHHDHHHEHGHGHELGHDLGHAHGEAGCSHVPGPSKLDGIEFYTAAVASGIRPCTGALIVLLFALASDVFLIGILSAIAMGIGVAITISTIGISAILARRGLMRLSYSVSGGGAAVLTWLPRGLAFLGSLAVFLIGLTLFLSAYSRIG